ncbi:MAG TPA: tetratricopeptide repeat protein, partial [Roseiflexaceae bacterium]|nr:tetratricopeptide repeat protein [Roseiflexaceae bacterium]
LWGDILLEAGRLDEAETALRAAVAADPSAGNWNKLGVMLIRAGRLERAEEALRQALAADPGAAEPHLRLGELYEQRGDNSRAAEHYRRYLEVAPADAPYRGEAQDGLARVSR